jgi:hypothetical protein
MEATLQLSIKHRPKEALLIVKPIVNGLPRAIVHV